MSHNIKPASKPGFEVLALGEDMGAVTETIAVVRRRAPRIDVKHFSPGVTIGKFGNPARAFQVKNIAEYGASILTEGRDLSIAVGHELICQVTIGNIVIPVRGRLLYISRELAGMEFIDPSQAARLAIRTHFFFEFGVAGLGASPKVALQDAGKRRTISYGDIDSQGMEVSLENGNIQSFSVGLGHIGAEVRWSRGDAIRALVGSGDHVSDLQVRNQLICFLRNVRGLNPFIRKSMEDIFIKSPIDFQMV